MGIEWTGDAASRCEEANRSSLLLKKKDGKKKDRPSVWICDETALFIQQERLCSKVKKNWHLERPVIIISDI